MWPNPHLPADLVTFTEETLNGKPHCFVQYIYTFLVYIRIQENWLVLIVS